LHKLGADGKKKNYEDLVNLFDLSTIQWISKIPPERYNRRTVKFNRRFRSY
jgi:hypothetical protein